MTYPGGGGEHVLVLELEAVHLLQDHSAVLFTLEEVGAAEDGGDSLRLVSLDQHCGGRVIGLHTPGMGRREEKETVKMKQSVLFYTFTGLSSHHGNISK